MAEHDDSERTEDPTPQRREDFRKRGQVAQSREVASVLILMMTLIAMWLLGRFFLGQLHEVFTRSFSDYAVTARDGDWINAVKFAGLKSILIVGPLAGILWLGGAASSIVQIGFLNNEEALKFDPNRLNPVEGFKRIFALRSVVEGLKAVLKVTLIAVVVWFVIQNEIEELPQLSNYDVQTLFSYMGRLLLKLFGFVGIFMLAMAGADYFFQRWDLEKKMRMTKQEVKEEIKSREGDPLVRARVRKLQRELANRRMMEDVKKADVIITNPTHIAVALIYSKELVAPRLVAKGGDAMAEKIKAVAREHNVPIVENKPLARTIFRTMKIGQVIPRELYTAVAEVLSYVFRLRKKRFV